jgi:hypothetical protein
VNYCWNDRSKRIQTKYLELQHWPHQYWFGSNENISSRLEATHTHTAAIHIGSSSIGLWSTRKQQEQWKQEEEEALTGAELELVTASTKISFEKAALG